MSIIQNVLLYLVILTLGGIVGKVAKLDDKHYKYVGNIQFACLLILLFLMGANLGINKEIVANVGKIGFNAAVFSIFTIGFSVIGVFIYRKIFMKNIDEILKEDNNDN